MGKNNIKGITMGEAEYKAFQNQVTYTTAAVKKAGKKGSGSWLRNKISRFFGGIESSIKNFFGIHSPSKVFIDMFYRNLKFL